MEAFTKLRRHEWWQRYSDVLITDDQHGNIINLMDPVDPWPGTVTQLRTVIYRAAEMKHLRVVTELRDSGTLLFVRCYTPQQAAQSPGPAVRSARPREREPYDVEADYAHRCTCGLGTAAGTHPPSCKVWWSDPQGQEPGY
jgi:hypothetical protein